MKIRSFVLKLVKNNKNCLDVTERDDMARNKTGHVYKSEARLCNHCCRGKGINPYPANVENRVSS